jgi:hypothetical protein
MPNPNMEYGGAKDGCSQKKGYSKMLQDEEAEVDVSKNEWWMDGSIIWWLTMSESKTKGNSRRYRAPCPIEAALALSLLASCSSTCAGRCCQKAKGLLCKKKLALSSSVYV